MTACFRRNMHVTKGATSVSQASAGQANVNIWLISAAARRLLPALMEATDHFWQAVLLQARSNNVSEVSRRLLLHQHRACLQDTMAEPTVPPPRLQDRLRKLQSAHIMRSLAAKTSFSTAAGVVVRVHSCAVSAMMQLAMSRRPEVLWSGVQ